MLSALGMIVLMGMTVRGAPPETFAGSGGKTVRVAVEIAWTLRAGGGEGAFELELTEGRVVEALAWPGGERLGAKERAEETWNLGPVSGGRVRALIEAPLGASLRLQRDGQAVLFPVLALIEAPQRTPPQAPVEINVERLPWDALMVELKEGDGTVAPGATVPVSVGYNILTPEPTEVTLRCSVQLRPIRGDDPVWHDERHEVVTTDQLTKSPDVWNVVAPSVEGTYVLEVRTTWEPVPGSESASTRLWRWIRRRRNPVAATSSTRRLTLVVLGPRQTGPNPPAPGPIEPEVEAIDLARLRGFRPVASGRAPLSTPGNAAWAVPRGGAGRGDPPRPAAGLDHAERVRGGEPRTGRRLGPGLVGPGLEGCAPRTAAPADAHD